VHFAYANPTDTNLQDNKEQTKDKPKTTCEIYPRLNQGYSEELNQNVIQKTYSDDIENQSGTMPKTRAKNNIGFDRIEKIDNTTLLKLACLCAVLPVAIFAGGVVITAYLITQHFK
jgi:hypothetical protein